MVKIYIRFANGNELLYDLINILHDKNDKSPDLSKTTYRVSADTQTVSDKGCIVIDSIFLR